jgi:hypothetical protein
MLFAHHLLKAGIRPQILLRLLYKSVSLSPQLPVVILVNGELWMKGQSQVATAQQASD